MTDKAFVPGNKVRFTKNFLKSVGLLGCLAAKQRWTVVPCQCDLCLNGRLVAVDEPLDTSSGYEDQTQEWRDNAKRHIAASNLELASNKRVNICE